jgi:hypothetical protein
MPLDVMVGWVPRYVLVEEITKQLNIKYGVFKGG